MMAIPGGVATVVDPSEEVLCRGHTVVQEMSAEPVEHKGIDEGMLAPSVTCPDGKGRKEEKSDEDSGKGVPFEMDAAELGTATAVRYSKVKSRQK